MTLSTRLLSLLHLAFITLLSIPYWSTADRIITLRADRWQPEQGHPGLKLRLTRRGAEYVKEIGVKLLGEQLASLHGFRASHEIQQPGLAPGSHIQLTEVRTVGFQPPLASHISFATPSYIVFMLEDMSISIAARFFGSSGLFQVSGGVHGQLVGLRINLITEFRATVDGLMAVRVANCSSYVHHSNFVLEPEGPLGPLVKIFEVYINDLIRQRIPAILCRSLTEIIERNSPRLFARLTATQLGEHFQSINVPGSVGIVDKFIHRMTNGLYLDGRMIENPVITGDFFETQQRGELRYNNSGSDNHPPFFPKPMHHESYGESERMLYIYGSDFTLNSLLYHAYQSDRLTIRLDESTLPEIYRGFIRTTCDSNSGAGDDFLQSICVGKLIPAIAEHYPNTTARFVLIPYELPEVKFSEGVCTMDLRTRILTYITDEHGREHQILVSTVDGLADIKLSADDGKFSGDLKLRKLAVHLHRSAIGGIDPESIAQLAPLAKTFLGPSLAGTLKQGLPYPLQESVTFLRPTLSIHDGYVRLATDFALVEQAMRGRVAEAFQRIREN